MKLSCTIDGGYIIETKQGEYKFTANSIYGIFMECIKIKIKEIFSYDKKR